MKKLLVVLFLILPTLAFAQSNQRNPCYYLSASSGTWSCQPVALDQGLPVKIVSGGGSGGTASTFGTTFPSIGTAVGALDTNGNMSPFNLDASGNLKVTGGGGGGTVVQGNAGSNAQAWWARIGDATSGPVKVQAGNSAAISDLAMTVTDPNVLAAVNSPIPTGTNTIGNINGAPNITPTNCSGTITTGGTAQNAFTAGATKHGFTIVNIDTTEPMWISFTTTAASATAGSYPLQAATATTFAGSGSFTTPIGFGMNTALSVIAATTGHKFSCTVW